MYISLLYAGQNVPWTLNSKLCDRRYPFIKYTSANKIDFDPTLIDYLAVNAEGRSDIRNCITFDKKDTFLSHLQEINDDLRFINPAHVYTDVNHEQVYDLNGQDYRWSSFVVVTKGDFEHSATRVRCALYIPKLFPFFCSPYVILSPHPKTPFFEWKTPGLECFYAEIDCYLKNTIANSRIDNIGRQIGNEIRSNLRLLITRCHRERNHPVIAPQPSLPSDIEKNSRIIAKLRQTNCFKARHQGNFALFSEDSQLDPVLTPNYDYWRRVLALSYATNYQA